MGNGFREWEATLSSGSVREYALETIAAIGSSVLSLPRSEVHFVELAERSLLFAYLARTQIGEVDFWKDHAISYLTESIERIIATERSKIPLWLHGGLAGFGWIVEHVSKLLEDMHDNGTSSDFQVRLIEDDDNEDPLAEVDKFLELALSEVTRRGLYDLIGGVVGIGVYGLERTPRPAAMRLVEAAVDSLQSMSKGQFPGRFWLTPPQLLPAEQRQVAPSGYYNLGVAHGIPGIVGFLGQVVNRGIATERAKRLLEEAVAWLQVQQLPPGANARYSNWIVPGERGTAANLGWCYGDLGISGILCQASASADLPHLGILGKELAESVSYWSEKFSFVNDAALCHGAFGVAHIFARLSNLYNDEHLKSLASAWYAHGLSFRWQHGVGGFSTFKITNLDVSYEPDSRLLSGSIGIALALLAATTTMPPEWDRMLLLSSLPTIQVS